MIQNFASFNRQEIEIIFGERVLINISTEWKCIGISTDTRTIKAGNAFVAIRGENSDGHDRVFESFEKGASAAIVENAWFEKNNKNAGKHSFILVDNTLKALGRLAQFHRRRFDYPIIAVGGSNGKTTTKNMIAHVLSQKYKVFKTQGNFNNQIGVPLMLLSLTEEFDLAVIEMGTNEPGEISILSAIVEPTHGIITNIGKEHLEKFIDLDGVEQEETFLFGYLLKKGGIAFINSDDLRLKKYLVLLENRVSFGADELVDVKASIMLDGELHPEVIFSSNDRTVEAKLMTQGFTTALNAIAAAAVGFQFDLTDEELELGLETYEPEPSHGYARMLIEKLGEITLINDCYNANPDSMAMALRTLKELNCSGRKFAVLGDMKEMGEAAYQEHCGVLEKALNSADFIYITGNEMKKAYDSLKKHENLIYFQNKKDLLEALLRNLIDGDSVLIKGSRGMAMEEIVEKVKVALPRSTPF